MTKPSEKKQESPTEEKLSMRVVQCETAEELLTRISIWSAEKWHDKEEGVLDRSIYRGQSHASYELLPSAWRKNSLMFGRDGVSVRVDLDTITNSELLLYELNSVCAFMREANRSGLPLPDEFGRARALLKELGSIAGIERYIQQEKDLRKNKEILWPPIGLESMFALAQHHGFPTRLLDWSVNPYKAAYFALESHIERGCLVEKSDDSEIAVWSCQLYREENGLDEYDIGGVEMAEDLAGLFGTEIEALRWRLIHVPRFSNEYLRAQEGLFVTQRLFNCQPTDFIELDGFDFCMGGYRGKNIPGLVKYTLSLSETPRLLGHLRDMGITASTIYPSLDAAKRGIFEKQWLARNRKVRRNQRHPLGLYPVAGGNQADGKPVATVAVLGTNSTNYHRSKDIRRSLKIFLEMIGQFLAKSSVDLLVGGSGDAVYSIVKGFFETEGRQGSTRQLVLTGSDEVGNRFIEFNQEVETDMLILETISRSYVFDFAIVLEGSESFEIVEKHLEKRSISMHVLSLQCLTPISLPSSGKDQKAVFVEKGEIELSRIKTWFTGELKRISDNRCDVNR